LYSIEWFNQLSRKSLFTCNVKNLSVQWIGIRVIFVDQISGNQPKNVGLYMSKIYSDITIIFSLREKIISVRNRLITFLWKVFYYQILIQNPACNV